MSLGTLSNLTFDNHIGRITAGGLRVIRLERLRPHPLYICRCTTCNSEFSVPHSRITIQKCLNTACIQPLRKPSRRERERETAREQERLAQEAALRHAAIRMEEATEGYERPTRYAPKPSNHVVMSERQRIEARQRSEELEAEERAEREKRERPVREVVDKLNATHRRLAELERQRLTDPKTPDDRFWHDDECDALDFLTAAGIAEYNAAAFTNFVSNHREFAVTDRNLEVLNAYFSKHSVLLFTHEMLERFYQRAIACGIEFDKSERERPELRATDYTNQPRANLTVAPAKKTTISGFDPVTGEPREFSTQAIDRMSSEEYRRAFRLQRGKGDLSFLRSSPKQQDRS